MEASRVRVRGNGAGRAANGDDSGDGGAAPTLDAILVLPAHLLALGDAAAAGDAAARSTPRAVAQRITETLQLCAGRGIRTSATLLAQLLASLPPPGSSSDADSSTPQPHATASPAPVTPTRHGLVVVPGSTRKSIANSSSRLDDAFAAVQTAHEMRLENNDYNAIELALCYLQASEFDRATWTLHPELVSESSSLTESTSSSAAATSAAAVYQGFSVARGDAGALSLSQRALFIAAYARFLQGDRRRDEEALGKDFLADAFLVNAQIKPLITFLEAILAGIPVLHRSSACYIETEFVAAVAPKTTSLDGSNSSTSRSADPFLYYLLGLCYNEAGLKSRAIDCFITALQIYPYLWPCWHELVALLYTREKLLNCLPYLPRANFMFDVFLLHLIAAHDTFPEYLDGIVDHLDFTFPGNGVIVLQQALVYYRRAHPDASEHFFERYRTMDPFSFEHLDSHSNVLFVRNDMVKLSPLAREYFERNRYKPEACIAVGNYYSLRREHAQAIQYFRRAIRLRRNFPEAWVLIGHEHIEVKHPNAALEAYRRAADLAPWDHKAWYGMGSILQTLGNCSLALPYYKRASECRPNDARIWNRMATAYQALGDHKASAEAKEMARKLSEEVAESIFS